MLVLNIFVEKLITFIFSSLIIHNDSEPNLLVRACNQLGQFMSHRETNLRSGISYKTEFGFV